MREEPYQRGFVIERCILVNGFQRQRAVHRTTLQVYIAELPRQPRCDGALARPCRAVDGDDQFAVRVIVVSVVVHFASRRLYTSMFPVFRLPFRLKW
jgi:hypothetical protein